MLFVMDAVGSDAVSVMVMMVVAAVVAVVVSSSFVCSVSVCFVA